MITYVKDRPGHDKRYSLDTSKLFQLGWQPQYNFAEALEDTIRWYESHIDWWRDIKQKRKDFQDYYTKQYS